MPSPATLGLKKNHNLCCSVQTSSVGYQRQNLHCRFFSVNEDSSVPASYFWLHLPKTGNESKKPSHCIWIDTHTDKPLFKLQRQVVVTHHRRAVVYIACALDILPQHFCLRDLA